MFYHVYADLVIVLKSTELNKSVLNMNQHYLELKLFLEEVLLRPDIIFKMNVAVFTSEVQLYNSSKIDHCNSSGSASIHTRLFKECNSLVPRTFAGGGRVWRHWRLFLGSALECRHTNHIASITWCNHNNVTVI